MYHGTCSQADSKPGSSTTVIELQGADNYGTENIRRI